MVHALAGVTRAQSRIAMNAGALLNVALVDSPCRVFNSDIKVRIGTRIFRYADLAVTCDPRDDGYDQEDEDYISFPTLILETLSTSTRRQDRSTTFEEYGTIPTFRDYVLAEPDRMVVHLYRRQDDGSWSLTTYEAADEAPLESLGVRLPVVALYHKVRLRPGGQ
jgi:Uma2 family endonuclease